MIQNREPPFALRSLTAAFVMALSAFAPTVARAEIDEAAMSTEARKACLSGAMQAGIDRLVTLYLETRKPTYLHNQARCYEQNGQYESAVARYREYLRVAEDLPSERRASVEASVLRLEESIARRQTVPAATVPAPNVALTAPPPAVAAPPSRLSSAPSPTPMSLGSRAADPRGNPALRMTGYILAGTGIAALLAGTVAGLVASGTSSDLEADAAASRAFDMSKQTRGERAAHAATISFIAGPTLLATGAFLYWVGRGDPARVAGSHRGPTTSSLTPLFARDGAQLLLTLRH